MFHRYFIKYEEKQATLEGKEHREAVHIWAFAAAGLFGRTGAGGRHHRVLTWVLCELNRDLEERLRRAAEDLGAGRIGLSSDESLD